MTVECQRPDLHRAGLSSGEHCQNADLPSCYLEDPSPSEGIMRELGGKTAFVTGGASGIGLALGRAFAQAGMKVMLADIEAEALAAAVESLAASGPDIRGVACDVADPASVEHAAKTSFD